MTELEFVLMCWAIIATGLWLDARSTLAFHRRTMGEMLIRIGLGKLKVVRNGDEFKLMEVE